ncbi:hypothetical protein [Paludibacterium purpuratum]|uniref:NHL repeat-containing protein n=1 Tax=Paludibacterium purpuratum TaxID=1144873 RepID=A0A4R7B0J1_9NEIS|nr:hypothetical protein [Paludibacterium purpuratum]TDR76422.1 NHL repeat-containing protein [Paludibacterium purpuratum]
MKNPQSLISKFNGLVNKTADISANINNKLFMENKVPRSNKNFHIFKFTIFSLIWAFSCFPRYLSAQPICHFQFKKETINAIRNSQARSILSPAGMAVDSHGILYICDDSGSRIISINPNGVVKNYAGTFGQNGLADGKANSAKFNRPIGIAIDDHDTVFIADAGNNAVRMIANGVVKTLYHDAGDSEETINLYFPKAIVVDAHRNLFISNVNTISKLSKNVIAIFSGNRSDKCLGLCETISRDGNAKNAMFHSVDGMFLNKKGEIIVADSEDNQIRKVSPDGTVSTIAGFLGKRGYQDGNVLIAQFSAPTDVVQGADESIYVADMGNHVIRKISTDGSVTTFAGSMLNIEIKDGFRAQAGFSRPSRMAIDSIGNIYITESYSGKIRKIDKEGNVKTVADIDNVH